MFLGPETEIVGEKRVHGFLSYVSSNMRNTVATLLRSCQITSLKLFPVRNKNNWELSMWNNQTGNDHSGANSGVVVEFCAGRVNPRGLRGPAFLGRVRETTEICVGVRGGRGVKIFLWGLQNFDSMRVKVT